MLNDNIKQILANKNPNFLFLNLYKNKITSVEIIKLKQYAKEVYMYRTVAVKVGVSTSIAEVNIIDILLFKSNSSTKITAVIAIIIMQDITEIVGIAIKLFNLSISSIPHLPSVSSHVPALEYAIEFHNPS